MNRLPTSSTQIIGVIGDPVRQSLSPVIHNAAFQAEGLDYVYVAFPVAAGNGTRALDAMRTLGLRGIAVTMPHKDVVAAHADVVTDAVRVLGAANTIVNDAGTLHAYSTDGQGCIYALRAASCDVAGKRCMVIGAGGAGRAVVLALANAGAGEIVVVNRGDERANHALQVAGSVPHAVARRGSTAEVAAMDVIINATPQGMGKDGSLPLDVTLLRSGQFVNDLVYHPLETPLLAAARAAGATPVDGLGMLIHQAGLQFGLWTGGHAPLEVMRAAALRALNHPDRGA